MVNTALETKYHVVTRPINLGNLQKGAIEEVLNLSASEGYEFVSMMVEMESRQILYFFKRS